MDFLATLAYAIIAVALTANGFLFDQNEWAMSVVSTGPAKVFVHLLPNLIPAGSLRGGLAVVVDVLRATTVMVEALAAGCEAVIPCGTIHEAQEIATGLPAGTALLAGERQGLPIEGFDLGNSPAEFIPDICREKTVITTTTNGTPAILASLDAERVYVAGFTNLRATSDEISVQFLKKDHGHSVHIVCAGTDGHISLEDSLLAGALLCQIAEISELSPGAKVGDIFGNDEALIAVSQWLEVERFLERRPLWKLLSLGRGGRNVIEIGEAQDIEHAAHFDRYNLVAELKRDTMKIVAV